MAETESVTPKVNARPIVRLGIFLISHSLFFSVICCTAGVLALLLLPVLAKNTYVSENALMPGSATPLLSSKDVSEGNKLVNDLAGLDSSFTDTIPESQQIIARYMSDLSSEVNYHKFYPQLSQFHPLDFFSGPDSGIIWENTSCSAYAVNTVGIIRAPRGDGKEAIVLVTPYNFANPATNEALSLGIAYSVFSLLSQVTWLAKDIVWLVADSRYGEYAAVSAWLRDYHSPNFGQVGPAELETCSKKNYIYELNGIHIAERKRLEGFRRAGTMAAALVIKVANGNELYEDSLSIYAEASNGQMPNLDLINIVNYLAVHRQHLRVKVEKLWYILGSKWLKIIGEIFESVGHLIRTLNPGTKFGIPATDYIEGAATLASSLYYQALGVPTGSHGAFRDYQVDAITLELSPKISSQIKHGEFLVRSGKLVEGVIRSVNNLLEKLHQSFFLYMLTSPSKFLSVGVYMIAFALLVAPLPVVAASHYVHANTSNSNLEKMKSAPSATTVHELTIPLGSWKWLSAAKSVFVVHLWGAVVSLLPYFICQLPSCTATTSIIIWTLLSMLNLLILNALLGSPFVPASDFERQAGQWAFLKSATVSSAFIGLCLMSVINFATAEIGALLIVPMCLMAQPLKLDFKVGRIKTLMRAACNLVILCIGFPPAGYFILKGMLQGFSGLDVGDFWIWMETLWAWNSATFLFIGLVQLPCWVLCVYILLHPC